ncbi:hypothetical protein [Mesorhizobium sp. INR15]|uniref:hypothetical protein n=1 Tax=Mesorhizobium sp. INR15 TaxID=2654248 RepID=UPI0018965DE2|nr:hypothetical protein [Mesorhizobium sp. INR15]QPC95542.1 hypothetical protein GA829_33705 [Mesorhizobium sp. INR15]
MDIKGLVFEILAWLQVQLAELAQLWSLYQLVIILALFTVARLAASRVELGLEKRARKIRGHQGLLRVVRGGLVCLNSFRAVVEWISALVRLPSGLMTAH